MPYFPAIQQWKIGISQVSIRFVINIPTYRPDNDAKSIRIRFKWQCFLGHGWFFAKLNITNILLLDYFGGAATISVEDYFKATPY